MKPFKKFLPIIIGALLSIPLAIGAFFYTQGALTRANITRPENVKVTQIGDTQVLITWSTDQKSQGTVEYGLNPAEINRYAPEIVPNLKHSVELTLLSAKTPYYFRITVGGETFDNDGVPWTFTTKTAGEKAEVQGVSDQLKKSSIPRDRQTGSKSNSGNGNPIPTLKVVDEQILLLPTSAQRVILQQGSNTVQPTKKQPLCPKTTNCNQIKSLLGKGCTSTEYVACLKKEGSVQGANTDNTDTSTHRKINSASPTRKPTLALPESVEE